MWAARQRRRREKEEKEEEAVVSLWQRDNNNNGINNSSSSSHVSAPQAVTKLDPTTSSSRALHTQQAYNFVEGGSLYSP